MARRFYAVQVGNDTACDYGSTRKREAYKMAREEAKEHPYEQVAICWCTTEDNFCDYLDVIQEKHPFPAACYPENAHCFALFYPDRNFDDSDEKIAEWNTATVVLFPNQAARDEAAQEDGRYVPITAKRASKLVVMGAYCKRKK